MAGKERVWDLGQETAVRRGKESLYTEKRKLVAWSYQTSAVTRVFIALSRHTG